MVLKFPFMFFIIFAKLHLKNLVNTLYVSEQWIKESYAFIICYVFLFKTPLYFIICGIKQNNRIDATTKEGRVDKWKTFRKEQTSTVFPNVS